VKETFLYCAGCIKSDSVSRSNFVLVHKNSEFVIARFEMFVKNFVQELFPL